MGLGGGSCSSDKSNGRPLSSDGEDVSNPSPSNAFHANYWRLMMKSREEPLLRRAYAIPSSVVLRFPDPGKGVGVIDIFHEVCVYENKFKASLRLPFHPLVRDFLFYFNLAPSRIKPNRWMYYISCYILWPLVLGEGTVLTIREFLAVYRPVKYDWLFSFKVQKKSTVDKDFEVIRLKKILL
jgi:hypothetical protein